VKVVFSAQAKAGLISIADHIAKDSPRHALRFIERLREQALELGEMPTAFPLVPRYAHLGIRRRPAGNYLIFYRVDADAVAIVHILHGAMDYEALLFSD